MAAKFLSTGKAWLCGFTVVGKPQGGDLQYSLQPEHPGGCLIHVNAEVVFCSVQLGDWPLLSWSAAGLHRLACFQR